MSDLLKKKPRPIEKGAKVVPRTTFSMDDLPTPDVAPTPQVRQIPQSKPVVVEKTTTVRVSLSMKDKLNALVTMGVADTVDQLTDVLVDEYVSNLLSKDEKKQFEIILDAYKKKNRMNRP